MLCVRKSQKLQNIMKINYVVKKFECIEIYKNIDDFFKMQFECLFDDFLIDNTFDDINCIFNLSYDIKQIKLSYCKMKCELKKNNIKNYVIICDFEHEKFYLIDKQNDNFITNKMYQFNFDFENVENNKLYEIDDTSKLNIAMYYLYEICHCNDEQI
jgi:hypothetical protein